MNSPVQTYGCKWGRKWLWSERATPFNQRIRKPFWLTMNHCIFSGDSYCIARFEGPTWMSWEKREPGGREGGWAVQVSENVCVIWKKRKRKTGWKKQLRWKCQPVLTMMNQRVGLSALYKQKQKRKVSRQIKRNVQSVPCEGTDLSRERERENAIKSTAKEAGCEESGSWA